VTSERQVLTLVRRQVDVRLGASAERLAQTLYFPAGIAGK
jgi:hypothetical protein